MKQIDWNYVKGELSKLAPQKQKEKEQIESYDQNNLYTYHCIFKGQVQGVSFRNTVSQFADRFLVFGTAENLDDKSVECYFYGCYRDVAMVVGLLLSGNGIQKVDNLVFKRIKTKEYTEFTVIYPKVVYTKSFYDYEKDWDYNEPTKVCKNEWYGFD